MNSGLQELGLALFTTLSPSCIVAVAVVACAIVLTPAHSDRWESLAHRLIILLTGALVGFLASARQLGSPDNALFVFTGIGRSPLSNEVTSVVVFLGMAGLFWLSSFFNLPRTLRKLWTASIIAAACIATAMMAHAYSSPTILTWYSAFVPANLVLSALVGGLTIGGLYLRLNGEGGFARCQKALCACAALLLCANLAALILQNQSFAFLANSFVSASEVMQGYPISIALYCLFSLAGIAASLLCGRLETGSRKAILTAVAATALIIFGIFVIRFEFYEMYMTVGL